MDVKNEPKKDNNEVVHLKNTAPESGYVSPAALAKIVADAVAEALKVAIPAAAVGINAAQTQANEKTRAALVREVMRKTKRCPICALPETACGGAFKKDAEGADIVEKNADGSIKYCPELNHVKAFVGPSDPNLFKWFQGFIITGVRFLSDYPGHRIWIPKKSDILTNVNAWANNERELLQKRTAEGQGAGSIGPGGQAMKGDPRAIGWR